MFRHFSRTVLRGASRLVTAAAAAGSLAYTARLPVRCEEPGGGVDAEAPPARSTGSVVLTCPGPFEDLEDRRSIDVHVSNGLSASFVKILQRNRPPSQEEVASGAVTVREPAILQAGAQWGSGLSSCLSIATWAPPSLCPTGACPGGAWGLGVDVGSRGQRSAACEEPASAAPVEFCAHPRPTPRAEPGLDIATTAAAVRPHAHCAGWPAAVAGGQRQGRGDGAWRRGLAGRRPATRPPSLSSPPSQVTPQQIMGYEVEAKHVGRDFHVVASLASTDALSSSLVYHQAVTPQARPARAGAPL